MYLCKAQTASTKPLSFLSARITSLPDCSEENGRDNFLPKQRAGYTHSIWFGYITQSSIMEVQ